MSNAYDIIICYKKIRIMKNSFRACSSWCLTMIKSTLAIPYLRVISNSLFSYRKRWKIVGKSWYIWLMMKKHNPCRKFWIQWISPQVLHRYINGLVSSYLLGRKPKHLTTIRTSILSNFNSLWKMSFGL